MSISTEPLTESQLQELRLDLERELQRLSQQLKGLAQDTQPVQLDQQVQGRLSRMDALQQQAMSQAGERQARRHLQSVERALQAMQEEDFGYCRRCEYCIGFLRLKARPDSFLCVKCAELAEQI
jgi:DnaK suppressor protein